MINIIGITVGNSGDQLSGGTPSQPIVTHFVMIGQSQLGGYNNQPALTTNSVTGVSTLTNGQYRVNK